jgi:hypothetical protein
MTTKQQEREALAKIREIVDGLGEDSYIGTALEGCLEIAEENIDNDFACSMKQRADCWEKKSEELFNEILDLKEALYLADKKAKRLERQLEKEQEWKPYTDERLVPQLMYDQLSKFGRKMTDDEATEWIASEFGFDPAKIQIIRTMDTYEINRHNQLRKVGEIDRSPYYDATDWYYVYFTVAGWVYEAYNGSIQKA